VLKQQPTKRLKFYLAIFKVVKFLLLKTIDDDAAQFWEIQRWRNFGWKSSGATDLALINKDCINYLVRSQENFCLTTRINYHQNIKLHHCIVFTSRSGNCSLLQPLPSLVAGVLDVIFARSGFPCRRPLRKHIECNGGVNRDLAMVGILPSLPGPPEFWARGWSSTRSRFLGGIFALKSIFKNYSENHFQFSVS